jgi:hypothetical protein
MKQTLAKVGIRSDRRRALAAVVDTALVITLDPDFRMIARVVTRNVNLLMVLFLVALMAYS